MPFTITLDGALPRIVEYPTVIDLIPVTVPLQALLDHVVRQRKPARMLFADGTTGVLAGTAAEFDPSAHQLSLPAPLAPPPVAQVMRDFEIDCKIMIEIEARVHCSAADRTEAADLVKTVMHGVRAAPRDFSVEIDREQLMHVNHNFDRPHLRRRELDRMDPHDVLINRIEER